MTSSTMNPTEISRISFPGKKVRECFDNLENSIHKNGSIPIVYYIHLGRAHIRLLIYDTGFLPIIRPYLGYVLKEEPAAYSHTIVLWKSTGITVDPEQIYHIVNSDTDKYCPVLVFYKGGVSGFNKESGTYYCGFPECSLERMILNGDIFLKQFYKILREESSSLVHGACIGIEGKGILLCARGGKGKSTLAVSALMKGFEYVADDYLLLDSSQGTLIASPVYSIAKLSYKMYDIMKEDLGNAYILHNNQKKNKYIIDISDWHDKFRTNYPISACILPEIEPGLSEPSVIRCTTEEKGKGIIHLVHSTMSQLMEINDNSESLKLIRMLQDKDFYRIRLCPDIYRNVECLRSFLNGI